VTPITVDEKGPLASSSRKTATADAGERAIASVAARDANGSRGAVAAAVVASPVPPTPPSNLNTDGLTTPASKTIAAKHNSHVDKQMLKVSATTARRCLASSAIFSSAPAATPITAKHAPSTALRSATEEEERTERA
jgi:hypothetical protein